MPNYSEPMHCLVGSLLWQEILRDHCFDKKKQHVITEADYRYYKYYKYHKFIGKKIVFIRFQL